MKKIIYGAFLLSLIAFVAIGYLYLTKSKSSYTETTYSTDPNETLPAKDLPQAHYEPFNGEVRKGFSGDGIAFEYPWRWNPKVVDSNTINLGIEADGVYQQSITFVQGDYNELSKVSDNDPNLSYTYQLSLYDRDGVANVWINDKTNRALFEYFAPGRNGSEVVKLTVEIDPDIYKVSSSYFSDLFTSITFLK